MEYANRRVVLTLIKCNLTTRSMGMNSFYVTVYELFLAIMYKLFFIVGEVNYVSILSDVYSLKKKKNCMIS